MPSQYQLGLSPDQIDDLVENTLHHFERDKWVDISTELQRYFAMDNYLLDDRISIAGGDQLQWQIKVRNTGAAKNTGMYAVDDIKVADVTKHAIVRWTKQTTNMAYDIDEPEFQSGNAVRILGLLQVRRHDALTSFAELMEDNFWGRPANATDEAEKKKPYGVPYWIVRNGTKGFNGSKPGSHPDVAGLDPDTYTRWRNYTGSYASIAKRDAIRLMREACTFANFRQPISHPSPVKGDKPRYAICTTYEVLQKMEELNEEQNTNLGNDIASRDGDTYFRKVPVYWIPWLEQNHDDTGTLNETANPYGKNPIYGIDRNSFRMVFKQGRFMKRMRPIIAPNQHSVRHVHWDSWCQFQCLDRRCNWVITQS